MTGCDRVVVCPDRSCGVSLYLMLTGCFPFARDSDDECTNVVRMQRMFTRIIQGDYAPLEQVLLLHLDTQDCLMRSPSINMCTPAHVLSICDGSICSSSLHIMCLSEMQHGRSHMCY